MKNMKQLVDETLNSLEGLQKAKAADGLYEDVLQRALNGKTIRMQRPVKTAVYLRVAACIILLAGINIFTLVHTGKKQQPSVYNSSSFSGEYFDFVKNI